MTQKGLDERLTAIEDTVARIEFTLAQIVELVEPFRAHIPALKGIVRLSRFSRGNAHGTDT